MSNVATNSSSIEVYITKRTELVDNFITYIYTAKFKPQIDPSPPATKEIVEAYNNLRGNILLLYDLRGALLQCDYELQAAKARLEVFAPERVRLPPTFPFLSLNVFNVLVFAIGTPQHLVKHRYF